MGNSHAVAVLRQWERMEETARLRGDDYSEGAWGKACRDRDEAVAVVRELLGLRGIEVPPLGEPEEAKPPVVDEDTPPAGDGWLRNHGGPTKGGDVKI